jgi:hypothetical protein
MQFYGDFCGFTFNGVHTSTLGITRVSDGSRYKENLGPAFQDKIVNVPGGAGSYFFETVDTQQPFDLEVAFDDVHEIQFRRMKQVFNSNVIGELIFDEAPYKVYTAKIQSPPRFQYICFNDEYNGERVYKGEGSISFVCYCPYARSKYKWLMDYRDQNRSEWAQSSGLLPMQGEYDHYNSSQIKLYNPGDLPTDWIAYYSFEDEDAGTEAQAERLYCINFGNNESYKLCFNSIQRQEGDSYIGINSKTQLIEGYRGTLGVTGFKRTGHLYNNYIQSGDFFKIPLGESTFYSYSDPTHVIGENPDVNCSYIDYYYLYY